MNLSSQPDSFRCRMDNFWYYHKWKVLGGIFLLVIAVVSICQFAVKQTPDCTVVLDLNGNANPDWVQALSDALSKRCPDVNSDGKSYVQVIDVSYVENSQLQSSQIARLQGVMQSGETRIYLCHKSRYDFYEKRGIAAEQEGFFAQHGKALSLENTAIMADLCDQGYDPIELFLLLMQDPDRESLQPYQETARQLVTAIQQESAN